MNEKLAHALGWAIGIVSLALASRPVDDPNGMLDPDYGRDDD